MLTLNQAVKNLEYIATAHNQINSFFFGELYDFASSGTINYPAMAVTLEPTPYANGVLTRSFNIYILDLVHKGIGNSVDVLSDTEQICVDVISLLQDSELYDWVVDFNTTLNDIQGGTDDEVYGYWFNLRMRMPAPRNKCAVPLYSTVQAVNAVVDDSDQNLLTDSDDVLQSSDGFNLNA